MTQGSEQAAQEFLSGKLAAVNVARIEKELAQLWNEAAHGSPETGTGPVVRACSFNLILITDDEDAELRCSDLLDEIEVHHPCRSILAVYRPQRTPHQLNAWVSARCHTVGPSKQICSEQVTVCCDNGKPDELASVVLPLVLPDLPVFIWWRQSKLDWQELNALHGCANKFIFDSNRQPSDPKIFIDAWKLVDASKDELFVADLNWRRLQGWRRAIADSFDGFPLPVESLNRIQKVTLTVSGERPPYNRVLLLAGWLASRLNWVPKSFVPQKKVTFARGNQLVEIVFETDDTQEGNHFQQVLIDFEGDKRQLVIAPERTTEARFITARLTDSAENEATRVANILAETVLVGQELEVLSRDKVFESTLEMVATCCGLKG
jgi:glucose-6-phosphate dehydrogenase assembly protein OpcA